MNLIRLAIERPIAVIAVVLMIVMFGIVAFFTIPIQLTPDVRKPIINIQTTWFGAAPAEIEREITNRQEDELKGLEGLDTITSQSQDSRARITLEFQIGTNMDKALLLVANRLDRVNGYPDEANEPTIRTSGSEDNPIAWIVMLRDKGNSKPVHEYGDFMENTVQDRLERVPGVSRVDIHGGTAKQMEVIVNPEQMARYGLTVSNVLRTLRAANASMSAGEVNEGKRRYVVRTEGDFTKLDDLRKIVLRSNLDTTSGRLARVTVNDIAEVRFSTKDPVARIRFNGQPALAVSVVRENGANVIKVMKGLKTAISDLNTNVLPRQKIRLRQVYDETVYINSAIGLVKQNIFVGGALAALMLLLFLRSLSATLIVSIAIPVSVVGAFVAMSALGRSLNVISLAGIAFAVGMVVDAAIVVIENIYRLRQQGLSRSEAAYKGTSQVWAAVFVSALTTVMVFIPILVMDLEVGQLFRDIAVALSVSVILSLLVAATVIPALSKNMLGSSSITSPQIKIPIIDPLAHMFVRGVLMFTKKVTQSNFLAISTVTFICGLGVAVTWSFLPKLEYLPDGNRNLIFGVIVPPPGYNLETTTDIAKDFEKAVTPLLVKPSDPVSSPDDPAKIERFFFVASRNRTFVGASAETPPRVGELIPVLKKAAFNEPGTFGFIGKRSLFGRGIGGNRSIDLDISGGNLETILETARKAAGMTFKALPRSQGTQMRPKPGLELGSPEVRVIPDRVRLADNGISARELGETIDTYNDGIRIAEITVNNNRMDLMLKGRYNKLTETQGIENLPVVASSGTILPANSLADFEITTGPVQIRHLERIRTVTLQITPPDRMPMEVALDKLKSGVIEPLQKSGLPPGVLLSLSGTADKLTQTWDAMVVNLIIAIVIVYLVMAVLFESFIYPLLIMLSVPLATAGGVLGLAAVNKFYTYQPLDMLTVLGFVILIGIVVNNAILLAHQTLYHIRTDKMAVADAVMEATSNRIRPIFMSTLTSVFGMMPLVLFPGAGSELYRGLGSVVLGGLALSAILTLAILPPLLTLVAGVLENKTKLTPEKQIAE